MRKSHITVPLTLQAFIDLNHALKRQGSAKAEAEAERIYAFIVLYVLLAFQMIYISLFKLLSTCQ